MTVFFAGASTANFAMYKLMPFRQPGRLFLLMQLSRIAILFLLWIQPTWWLLTVVVVAWGINMGFTTTLARTVVQESADEAFRGRIMSILILGMMGSAPVGAIILGWIIQAYGALDSLLPAMAISAGLFVYGTLCSRLWSYRSPDESVSNV